MSQIVPQYPKSHDWMLELAQYANTPLLNWKGEPAISMIAFIGLVMDDERDSSAEQYWRDTKRRMMKKQNLAIELRENLTRLKIPAQDGKLRLTDCGNSLAVHRVLDFIRDDKPEALRTALNKQSDAFRKFTQQNLFEGRPAFENEFHDRQLPMFTEHDDAFTDMGYNR